MSIIKMKKVNIIGLDTIKEQLISDLMEASALEITEQDFEGEDLGLEKDISEKSQERISYLEREIAHAESALEAIEKYTDEKPPLFFTRRRMKIKEFQREVDRQNRIREDVQRVLVLKDNLQRTYDEINRLQAERDSLRPWIDYTMPLQITKSKKTKLFLGIMPATVDLEKVTKEVEENEDRVFIGEVGRDKEFIYLTVICHNDAVEGAMDLMRRRGFSQINFKHFKGNVEDNIASLDKEIEKKKKWAQDVADEIRYNQDERKSIECYYDYLVMERDKEKIREKFTRTNRTFLIEGWVPEPSLDRVTAILDQANCMFEFRDPYDDETVPVLVHNPKVVVPFESVTEMYSQPDYRGIDPTKFFSFFYVMFFGIMLSDAGYGIVLTIACYVLLKKFDLEGTTLKMIKMFLYCGLSTVFWGALFGSWFGDFFQVAGRTIFGTEVSIEPLWFNPLEDPTRMLVYSLIIGVVHIFLAMGINAYMLIKDGKWFDAVCDVFTWYMIIGGAGIMLGGSFLEGMLGASAADTVSKAGMYIAIAGAAILLVFGGRHKKGIGKVLGGISSLYGITNYISDILSYSRLLALGLATGVIAQVVNTMGSLAGGGIFGTLVLLVAFVFGHTFNLAINALGAFVHSSRLQYIEFFGKFYIDGGDDFAPFMKNTKYIKILND